MTRKLTFKQWEEEGIKKFGSDRNNWKFTCPVCGHIASAQDYKNANAPESAIAFSCIGRWLEKSSEAFSKGNGPCNYAGGGLFKLNPVTVDFEDGSPPMKSFEFADGPMEDNIEKKEI